LSEPHSVEQSVAVH